MMDEIEGYTRWHEPLVGHLFGNLYYIRAKHRSEDEHFILGGGKDLWLGSVRNFVLDSADARFPEVGGGYLVVKEPQGSMGAPLLMEALPESRMILLVRDPRDVVASWLDATRKGGWQAERRKNNGRRPDQLSETNPNAFVKRHANAYLHNVGNAKRAYDAHRGRKVVVRYEELRSDALGTMRRMYAALGLAVDEGELAAAVERHAWEQIPEEEKGEGKFHRKAKPGGWQEDLTPKQAETVARITAPLLEEFYPA
jgi:hypothetical protein